VEIIEFEITEATEEDLDAIYDVDKKAFSYPMSRSSIERTYAIEAFQVLCGSPSSFNEVVATLAFGVFFRKRTSFLLLWTQTTRAKVLEINYYSKL